MARNPVRYCIQATDGKFLKITPATEEKPHFSPSFIGPETVIQPYDYKSLAKAQQILEHIQEYARRNTRSEEDRRDPIVRRNWRYTKYVDSLNGAVLVEISR